ncbi:MAG TPA: ferrous iron transporter B, partial [Desulfobacterales bacterium]|nr:ferrous iron transporter B [Desulfobacterales bacterium]
MSIAVALAGNPNSGKTTLFNALTGARQHVGNYPGVTVEKKEGTYRDDLGEFNIIDLPGTYSLTAYSMEEVVARDYLVNEKPAMVVDIIDASNLERNLYLCVQFLEMGMPVTIALNMMDVAKKRGIEIDHKKLSKLLNIPVVPTIARKGHGKKELLQTIAARSESKIEPLKISYGQDIDTALDEMEETIKSSSFLTKRYHARWTAIKYLENDNQIKELGSKEDKNLDLQLEAIVAKVTKHLAATLDTHPEGMIADQRYGFINSILKQGIVKRYHDENRLQISDRIDKVVTNRFLGPIIMGLYKFTFSYSEMPISWFESFFGWLSGATDSALTEGLLKSLIVSGIIDGVGGVIGFVPLIMFMFFGISLLEDSGYLA